MHVSAVLAIHLLKACFAAALPANRTFLESADPSFITQANNITSLSDWPHEGDFIKYNWGSDYLRITRYGQAHPIYRCSDVLYALTLIKSEIIEGPINNALKTHSRTVGAVTVTVHFVFSDPLRIHYPLLDDAIRMLILFIRGGGVRDIQHVEIGRFLAPGKQQFDVEAAMQLVISSESVPIVDRTNSTILESRPWPEVGEAIPIKGSSQFLRITSYSQQSPMRLKLPILRDLQDLAWLRFFHRMHLQSDLPITNVCGRVTVHFIFIGPLKVDNVDLAHALLLVRRCVMWGGPRGLKHAEIGSMEKGGAFVIHAAMMLEIRD